jgi:hypothetical protein
MATSAGNQGRHPVAESFSMSLPHNKALHLTAFSGRERGSFSCLYWLVARTAIVGGSLALRWPARGNVSVYSDDWSGTGVVRMGPVGCGVPGRLVGRALGAGVKATAG